MFFWVFLSRDTYGLWHWILFGRGTALPQYDCFCCHVWCCTQPLIGSVNLSKNNLLSFCCKSLFCSNHSVLRSSIGLSLCYYLHCSLHRFRHGCLLPPSFLASVSAISSHNHILLKHTRWRKQYMKLHRAERILFCPVAWWDSGKIKLMKQMHLNICIQNRDV